MFVVGLYPVDTLHGGRNASVRKRGINYVSGHFTALQSVGYALGNTLEAPAVTTREVTREQHVFGIVQVGRCPAHAPFGVGARSEGATARTAVAVAVDRSKNVGETNAHIGTAIASTT
mgnify:CR=1 FL=1